MSILIIEQTGLQDNDLVAPLKRSGLGQISLAKSYEEGLQMLTAEGNQLPLALDVELIILDAHNELEAAEICRRIKDLYQYQDVPIITVSEKQTSEALQLAFAFGSSDFINRPVREDELIARVRSALRLKHEIDRRKARERELLEATRQLSDLSQLLGRLSLIDSLTNIPNRRSFDESLEQEWRRAGRNRRSLSLAMIDVDHFKAFNDHYGHQAGDACLKQIAQIIRDALRRPGDFIARYGGEEFIVILPDTDTEGAQTVGEFLRKSIEAARIPHKTSDVGEFVTISVGVSTVIPAEGMSLYEFTKHADKTLYEAKAKGRNCVMSEELTTPVNAQPFGSAS